MPEQGSDPSQPTDAGSRERAALREAVLGLSGEHGYRAVTVESLAAHAGVPIDRFDLHFTGLADCFAAAHAERAARLEATLLVAGAAQAGWQEGLRAQLVELISFAEAETEVARALLIEVHVVGGEALARHEEMLRRLAGRLGRSGARLAGPAAPPPGTAVFLVGAVERAIRWRLGQGRPELLRESLPELMALLVAPYLGDEAAHRERARPG